MLQEKAVAATIPVRSLIEAHKFYADKLGLTRFDTDGSHYAHYQSGPAQILLYESRAAGGSKNTVATWGVGTDIEKIVQQLRSKGVSFRQFDIPGRARSGDIYDSNGVKTAWFVDPDGNILCLVNK